MNPFESDRCACITLVDQREFAVHNYEGQVRTFVFRKNGGFFKVEAADIRFRGMNPSSADRDWGFPQAIEEQEFHDLVNNASQP